MSTRPLGLFWWSPRRDPRTLARFLARRGRALAGMTRYAGRSVDNFGDELSPLMLEAATGRRVTWAPASRADVVGLGSILEIGLPHDQAQVWGSGVREPDSHLPAVDPGRIRAVRGGLTRDRLGLPGTTPLGDPGLLVRHLRAPGGARAGTVLLPHYSAFGRAPGRALVAAGRTAGWRVVVPTRPVREVVEAIASADLVLSSSLHGLVVAHALGVPGVLVDLGGPGEPAFKYDDYGSALGLTVRHHPFADVLRDGTDAVRAAAEADAAVVADRVDAVVEGLTHAAERLR